MKGALDRSPGTWVRVQVLSLVGLVALGTSCSLWASGSHVKKRKGVLVAWALRGPHPMPDFLLLLFSLLPSPPPPALSMPSLPVLP